MGNNPGQLCQINTGHLSVVITHVGSKRSNIFAERSKGLVTAEPLVKEAAVRKPSSKIGQGLCSISRCGDDLGFYVLDGVCVSREVFTELDNFVTKGSQTVTSSKYLCQPSTFGKGVGQFHKSLSSSCRIHHSSSINTSNSRPIRVHGLAKGNEGCAKGCKVITPCKELHDTPDLRKCSLKLCERLCSDCRCSDRFRVDFCDSFSIRFHSRPKRNDSSGKRGKIIASCEELHHSANCRKCSLQLSKGLCCDCGSGNCFCVDVSDSLPIGFHSCAEGNDTGSESAEIVSASEELHNASHIRENRLELSQRFGGSGRGGDSLCIDPRYEITV